MKFYQLQIFHLVVNCVYFMGGGGVTTSCNEVYAQIENLQLNFFDGLWKWIGQGRGEIMIHIKQLSYIISSTYTYSYVRYSYIINILVCKSYINYRRAYY